MARIAPFAAALMLAACAAAPEQAPAPAGRVSVLIAAETDPALGPATILVDGAAMGLLDPACGLVVSAPAGARLVAVVWADRRAEAAADVPPGGAVGLIASADAAGGATLGPAKPPEAAGFSCPAPEEPYTPATPSG